MGGTDCTGGAVHCSSFHAPCVGNVAWQTSGRNQDGVEAQGAAGKFRTAAQESLGGAADAVLLARSDGLGGLLQGGAGLDLDEGQNAAAPHDQVDFTRAGTAPDHETARHHPPAL